MPIPLRESSASARQECPRKGETTRLSGTVSLFGFPSAEAHLEVLVRGPWWRVIRAGAYWGGGLLLAPLAGMIPPHAPWALGVLGVGGLLGLRKWRERFTVQSLRTDCPRCGGKISLPAGTPLRPEMSVSCEGCRHDPRLTVHSPGS